MNAQLPNGHAVNVAEPVSRAEIASQPNRYQREAIKYIPYWLDTAPAFTEGSTQPIAGRADVVIVGGGLNGVSAALSLARRGAEVVLLEQGEIGDGASGRNGGMCTTGLAIGFSMALETYGAERASRMYRAYNDAIDCVENLVKEENIDCDFARHGKLNVASKPSHIERFKRSQALLEKHVGQQTTLVPRDQLASELGSDYYHGGWLDPLGSGLHVGKFVRGLASAAAKAGARLHEQAAVTAVRRINGHQHDVVTTAGTIRADQVLVATGSKTDSAFAYFRRRIVPVGSYIIVTEPLPRALLDELIPNRRMVSDTLNYTFYFRITPDDRLLFGGRARFSRADPGADPKSGHILHKAMTRVFPQLSDARIDYCWGGLVDLTQDRLPHAGEHDGLFYSLGHNGHGVQMATYMGQRMAAVMSGDADAHLWHDIDWPAIPGHFAIGWALPLIGVYYRLKDLVQ